MMKIKSLILLLVLSLFLVACDNSTQPADSGISQNSESLEMDLDTGEDDVEDSDSVNIQTSESDKVEQNDSEESFESAKQEESNSEKSSEENISESENSEGNANSQENAVETTSEEASEEISEEPEYTIEEYNAVLYVKQAVNVRIGPSTDYEKIGGLAKGTQVQVTGMADTGWYRIDYEGTIAFVSHNYLLDEAEYQAMLAKEEAEAEAARLASEEAARLAAEQQAQQEQQQTPAEQQPQVSLGDYRAQVVALMNQERAAAGVGGISQNAALDAVAQIRAQEIVQSFSHTRPNGSTCFTVLNENGIVYMTAGENIAAGYGTPDAVMNGWMNSEGHRANILNGSFGQVGIGYYTEPNSGYGTYWVQIFTN